MLSHQHIFYAMLAVGALLVVLYATGNLSNTSNVVVVLLFALLILAMAVAFEKPAIVPKGEVVEAVAT